MGNFLDRILNRKPASATQAKERLKLVLIHDRTSLSAGTMDVLKDDLIEVVSKHVEIEPDAVRIKMKQDGREQRLIADIPLRTSTRR